MARRGHPGPQTQARSLEGGRDRAEVAVAAQHDGDEVAGAADGRVHAALQAPQVRQRIVRALQAETFQRLSIALLASF